MNCEITPDNITGPTHREFLKEVFVFGSNLQGVHGKGAAKEAMRTWGATWGKGEGFSKNSYALPTKRTWRSSLTLKDITPYIEELLDAVRFYRYTYHFLITKVGCGYANHTVEEMAPLFKDFVDQENVSLPKEFIDVICRS